MPRQIVYEFARGGRVRATLLDDKAPTQVADWHARDVPRARQLLGSITEKPR